MHPIQENLLKLSRHQDLSKLSLRDIGKLIGEKHPSKVRHHLLVLEKNKLVNIDRRKSKIRLKDLHKDFSNSYAKDLVEIPIYGEANCGEPTSFAIQETDSYLTLSRRTLRKSSGVYILKAKGNSMNRYFLNGKNIENGDYLLIDPENRSPEDGDVIVSIIRNCANIKIFHYDRVEKRIVLLSNSSEYFDPIFIDMEDFNEEYFINGKVIQVIKKFTPEISYSQTT